MPRILIKGGIWKNTEDEILKAAVMKYGKNQWARIASLLHKKSAKQCKARWYEWLDPSIKKTEWSRDEEERLLHLAKLMPCQWRTIAPMVGRTPAQCLEHYEYLLDRAQHKEGDEDDPRKLRPGEIDPNPETKPARPDPVDMDEDEKEMLAEARARLANTQGKKAKRKAREKQMEEARRLASLQKKRELRAAGIVGGAGFTSGRGGYKRKRLRGVNYNEEIPFEKKAPAGFYDVSEETVEKMRMNFHRLKNDDIEGERRDVTEGRERKKDRDKQKKRKEKDLPLAVMQMNKLNSTELVGNRSKLVLPAPQISDTELSEVVQLGLAAEHTRAMAEETGTASSKLLLNDYSMTPGATPIGMASRTPRAPAGQDTILQEAQTLLALQNVDTPLKGGENTPMHDTSFEGATPRRNVMPTPNKVLASPFRTPSDMGQGTPRMGVGGDTPRNRKDRRVDGAMTPSMGGAMTPSIRDGLNINRNEFDDGGFDTEYQEQYDQRQLLLEGLRNLPAPKNDFEIVIPDDDAIPSEETDQHGMIEDAAEVEAKNLQKMKEEEERIKRTWSQAVQRDLPRPSNVNKSILRGAPHRDQKYRDIYEAEEMIKQEMLVMLRHDIIHHSKIPMGKNKSTVSAVRADLEKNPLEPIPQEDLYQAHLLLEEEMGVVKEGMNHGILPEGAYAQIWEECYQEVLFIPSQNRYTRASMASNKDRLESLEKKLQENRALMAKEAKRAAKLEKKLKILLGGYMARGQALSKQLHDTHEQVEQTVIELETFKKLQLKERMAMPNRLERLKEEVDEQSKKENQLQVEYANLSRERDILHYKLSTSSKTT